MTLTLAVILGFIIVISVGAIWNKVLLGRAKTWSSTEGKIQSGGMEIVGALRDKVELPCFSFSYVVDGEYYSGRFALWEDGERAGALIHELIDTKITVRYDPQRPSSFYLSDELIGGCGRKRVID